MPSRLILLFALIITSVLYWPGLSGPFIFDDAWNLEPVRLWLLGKASLLEAIFPYSSLVFSRPVSMASFALSAALSGDSGFGFKLGNLIVHLACGVVGFAVLRRALLRDERLAPHAELIAALAATFWLLHPLNVSTVLYVVQRMAQLSTLFTLAAVWVYLVARQQLVDGRTRSARLHLLVLFPLLVLLGVLSKQNAVVAPVICLALELAYFKKQSRPGRGVQAFFALFVALPALSLVALLLLAPQKLLATYAEWDFTIWERLLTQPRALMDYIGMLLFPRGPLMGLYTDDYAVSHGLLSPPSTLWCILALAGISITAIALRKRAPSVFAGWFFFLTAHGVESSFLPLEMYYEHRNYLPAFGLLLAVFGLLALVPAFRTEALSPRKLGLLAAGGFALVLAVATLGRALVWRDFGTIAQLGVKTHPDSIRARFDLSGWALERKDYATALEAMRALTTNKNPRYQQMGQLSMVVINCMRGDNTESPQLLQQAAQANFPKLTTFEGQVFGRLAAVTRNEGCGTLSRGEIARAMQQILDSAFAQPESATPKWFARYALSEIYARDNQWQAAQKQSEKAWGGGYDQKVGIFLTKTCLQNGDLPCAARVVGELDQTIKPFDKQGQSELADLKRMLAEKS